MKRQHTDLGPNKRLTFDDLLAFFQQDEVPLACGQLSILGQHIERHRLTQANLITQDFPCDMMLQIFERIKERRSPSPEKDPPPPFLRFALALRTVSKSWHSHLSKFDWSHWIEEGFDFNSTVRKHRLLKFLHLSTINFYLPGDMDFDLLKNCTTVIGRYVPDSLQSRISQLTKLRSLTVSSTPQAGLVCLTNLRLLNLQNIKVSITNIDPLTNLTFLELDETAGLTQASLRDLTKLQMVHHTNPKFFQGGRGRAPLDGGTYEGEWLDAKPHGKGIFRYTGFSCNEYEGDFVHGLYDGQGAYRYWHQDLKRYHTSYYGSWRQGKTHGKGLEMYPNGESLEAEWNNGWRPLTGKFRSNDGSVYDGELSKLPGVCNTGLCVYANGDRYQGQWKMGHRHGSGVYTFVDGRTFDGEWNEGEYLSSDRDPNVVFCGRLVGLS